MLHYSKAFLFVALAVSLASPIALAQQANVGSNFFFEQNSFGLAIPPFGGFDPGAGAVFGFGTPLGNGQASFNTAFGQGAQSSITSSSPSVTLGNGGFGAFSAGSWTPFVVGAVPVVGDAPAAGGVPFGPAGSSSLLQERLSRIGSESPVMASPSSRSSEPPIKIDSTLDPFRRQLAVAHATSGGTPTSSVASIEQARVAQRKAAEQTTRSEIDGLVSRGAAAVKAGKPKVARIYFQQAARLAEGPLKEQLLQQVRALGN